jgi:hypothetical protein
MGLDITAVRYHLHLKQEGTCFERVAMLGRQTFTGLTKKSLARICQKFGFPMGLEQARRILTDKGGYVEPFYEWLGARVIHSFDASDYEGATHIWDMNHSLPDEFRESYDFVFDGGTLEHVFHYTSALREVMTLPEQGGVFLSVTPANSYLGHGFYQFSPDAAFEAFSAKNGYRTLAVYLIEDRLDASFYEVAPPGRGRGRTLASGAWPTLMCFCGQRIDDVPPRLEAHQPDYSEAWQSGAHEERRYAGWKVWIFAMFEWVPARLRTSVFRQCRLLIAWIGGNSFWDRPSLTRVRNL